MNADGDDLVEKLHREAIRRFWEQRDEERLLIEEMHRATVARSREEHNRGEELLKQLHREAAAHLSEGVPSLEPQTIHHSELPLAKPDSPLCREWNYYRSEVGRLLAEGNANRHVLIKGEQIIGTWDTHEEAMAADYRLLLGEPFLVHEIQERERVLRCVTMRQCPNLPLRYRLAS